MKVVISLQEPVMNMEEREVTCVLRSAVEDVQHFLRCEACQFNFRESGEWGEILMDSRGNIVGMVEIAEFQEAS